MEDVDKDIKNEFKGDCRIVSNHVGPDGESIDRIYGHEDSPRLIQRDYSQYAGNINKKTILVKRSDGSRFRSHVFVTADGRYFDRGGLPITKESVEIEKESDDES